MKRKHKKIKTRKGENKRALQSVPAVKQPQTELPTIQQQQNNVFGNMVSNALGEVLSSGNFSLGNIVKAAKKFVEQDIDKLPAINNQPDKKQLTDGNG